MAILPVAITAEERARRQEWADFALANVGLEGLTPSAEAQERVRLYVEGKITMAELVDLQHEKSGEDQSP